MVSASLIDRKRLELRVADRRIPADAWVSVDKAEHIIDEANELWERVQVDAEALRAEARQQGFAAGRSEALSRMVERLAETQREMQDYLASSEGRVVELTLAVIRQIVPRLNQEALIRDLVSEALPSVHGQRYLLVRVHPGAEAMVRDQLQTWSQNQRDVAQARVVADATLDPLDVVVETESGTVHSGFNQQLSAVGDTLRRRVTESG